MNDETMKCGLLMETAQSQQGLAVAALERLKAHTQGLDAVVRDEIRRTLTEEMQALASESKSATRSLRALGRAANVRVAFWSIGIAALCCATTGAVVVVAARWLLPSRSEIAALTTEHDQLVVSIARLKQDGGRIDLRRCGDARRFCVRVDRKAPAFGQKSDYFIVAGY
jgi:hypothetical protein